MGCVTVRETPHVIQHWACKRNSPYKPAQGHARGAPLINQHEEKLPTERINGTIMECVRESHH